MDETRTVRIELTAFHPNGDVMERHTVEPHGASDKVYDFELLGYKVELETVITVETRTPYVECPYDFAHTQHVCGNPHCRES